MSPRSRILTYGPLALLALALLALPAAAGENVAGITVKRDGDDIVLIAQPGKAFLVLGFPYEKKGQEPAKGLPGNLSYLAGEARLPAKKYKRILVWELGESSEVDLTSWVLRPLPDPVYARVIPLKPYCPPDCPEASLVQGDSPEDGKKGEP